MSITYTQAAAKFGTVEHNGVAIALTQQAYADNYGTDGGVRYYAAVIDEDGNEYIVAWDTTSDWDDAVEAVRLAQRAAGDKGQRDYELPDNAGLLDDESNACDWGSPADIVAL